MVTGGQVLLVAGIGAGLAGVTFVLTRVLWPTFLDALEQLDVEIEDAEDRMYGYTAD